MKSRALAAAALFILAGCGGGGGGSTAAPQTPTTPSNGQKQTMNLVIQIPLAATAASAKTKRPQYVSPNATQIVVTVNSINGSTSIPTWVNSPATTALTYPPTAGSTCTAPSGGTTTCTIPVAAPPGSVSYTINVEDAANHVLATATQTVSITQGQTNSATVTLQGVVKTVSATAAALTADTPITAGEVVTVTALDASGNAIVNQPAGTNFANPITLTDNDATGQTLLTVNGGTAASTVTVNNPSDLVKLTYTGQAVNGFTITASGTGITGTSAVTTTVFDVILTGTTLDDAAHGGLNTDANWGQQTLFFSTASGTQGISAGEVGWTTPPSVNTYSQNFTITLSSACTSGTPPIATASGAAGTSFTITAGGATGICSGRIAENAYSITHAANVSGSATHDGTFWISVTTAGFTINSKQRHN